MDTMRISVFEVVGSELCVAADDGQRVYDQVAAALQEHHQVALSFLNVTNLTSAFLNAAVGQLYGEFTAEEVRAGLKVEDMSPEDLALLKRVVVTAKLYFKDPKRFVEVVRDATGEGDDVQPGD